MSDTERPSAATLLALLPIAILVLDDRGCVAQVNSAGEALLNRSERSLIGRMLDDVIKLPEAFRARGDGHGFAAYDIEVMTAHGHRLRLDVVEAVVADHPGWRVFALHEAPGSKHRQSGDRTGGARAAIGAAAMLAHEIKNPLSGIRGAAQLLASDGTDDGELTGLITAEVDRIAALIDRMQDFTDTRPLSTRPDNIYPLLGHVRSVALAGFARDIQIDERFDPSLPPAQINRDAFLQVMLNLLKNAAEAVHAVDVPRIALATAYRHGMSVRPAPDRPKLPLPIEILVIDNGPGAPADIVDHLFEPFVSGKPEGQGLGLPLVEKLVGDMGGIIQYAREGDPPVTVFRVLLPRGEA